MTWIIYKHTNLKDGKVYIGQSKYSWKNINDRWQDGRAYGRQTRIGMAIEKYGWNGFSHELVEEGIESQEKANEREIYWIKYYNSYSEGYNCTVGGKNIPKELNYKLKIYCLETNKTYESVMEASHKLNISYYFIQRQLTTGHYYEKDKYHFCVDGERDCFNPTNYIIQYDFSSIKKNVICVETKEIFDSIAECSQITGIKNQNLSQNCCIHHRSAKGKHYAYLEEYDDDWMPAEEYNTKRRKEASSRKKEVFCFENGKIYNSATECAADLGLPVRAVSRCAKKDGDLIQTHGYHFCYKADYYDGWKPRMRKNSKNNNKTK